jgi:hypothetical protein
MSAPKLEKCMDSNQPTCPDCGDGWACIGERSSVAVREDLRQRLDLAANRFCERGDEANKNLCVDAADAIETLTRERDELQAQLLHTTEWNTQWLLGHKERLAEATARAERAQDSGKQDALMDCQYIAGVKAGWNAAQSNNSNEALAQLIKSRKGRLTALTAPAADVWRHKARGTTYTIVGAAELQCAAPIPEKTQVTIYRDCKDGALWARPTTEFFDGRFVLAAPSQEAPANG